jgi:hypothetical protein
MRSRWLSGWTRRARRSEAASSRMRRVRPAALVAPSGGTGFARDGPWVTSFGSGAAAAGLPAPDPYLVREGRDFWPKFTKFTLATHFKCTSSQCRLGPPVARRALPYREIPAFAGMTFEASGDQLARQSSLSSHSCALRAPGRSGEADGSKSNRHADTVRACRKAAPRLVGVTGSMGRRL